MSAAPSAVVAGVDVAGEGLHPVGGELHRAPEQEARAHHRHVLVVDVQLHPEGAADIAPDGTLTAIEVDDVTGVGPFSAYPRTSAVEGNQVVRLIGAPYRLTDYRADLLEPVPARRGVRVHVVGHVVAPPDLERVEAEPVRGEISRPIRAPARSRATRSCA
jgi:hypothetical protein